MKLYYFKAEHGNFGDDLNPWLWDKLLPGFLDDNEREIFVGIGTLLNHRLPRKPLKHIFGSGYGYGEPPIVDETFVIHAVRGYETAKVLGIDKTLVVTDPAILLTSMPFPRAPSRDFQFGFMPHQQSSRFFGWKTLCDALGYHYISAEWEVEKVLFELGRCEVVICEAMHGAIAADTLRIPWIPVACYGYISAFKWKDWLSTLSLPYSPMRITSLFDIERDFPARERLKNSLKRGLRRTGIWSAGWTPPPVKKTGEAAFARALQQLDLAARREPQLSADNVLRGHVDRYLELIDELLRRRELEASRAACIGAA